jgi:hypothetical protein
MPRFKLLKLGLVALGVASIWLTIGYLLDVDMFDASEMAKLGY